MNWEIIVWLGLMILFLIVEASCPIHLVSIWFAVGSLAATLAAALGAELWLQIALFAVVSAGLLACLWPLTKKFLNPKVTATNVDSVIGSQGLVTEAIDNLSACGHVKLGAMEWSARSSSGEPIPVGSRVKADRIEGVKIFVSVVEVAAAAEK